LLSAWSLRFRSRHSGLLWLFWKLRFLLLYSYTIEMVHYFGYTEDRQMGGSPTDRQETDNDREVLQ
jgi:hypothetical protein